MLSINSVNLKYLENEFCEFCLNYFDDPSEGKCAIIKFPIPNIDLNGIKITKTLTHLYEILTMFIIKILAIKKEIKTLPLPAKNMDFKDNEKASSHRQVASVFVKLGAIHVKLTLLGFGFNSIRRFIFAYRFT